MSMGGGGGGDNYDAAYNAGILALSEHQQGMADEIFAFYKHGTGGTWEEQQVEVKPATTERKKVFNGSSSGYSNIRDGAGAGDYHYETVEVPAEYETKKVFVPDGTTKGYMDLENAQVQANYALVPQETETKRATLSATEATARAEEEAAESALRLSPNEENARMIELNASRATSRYAQAQADSDRGMIDNEASARAAELDASRNVSAFTGAKAISDMGMIDNEANARMIELNANRATSRFAQAQADSGRSLLPAQTALAGKRIADESMAIDDFAPVRANFYQEALGGVDADGMANRAAADAAHAFMNSSGTTRRNSARMGVNPNSGRFQAMSRNNEMDRAKAIGSARTQARTNAEDKNFNRLNTAMSFGR